MEPPFSPTGPPSLGSSRSSFSSDFAKWVDPDGNAQAEQAERKVSASTEEDWKAVAALVSLGTSPQSPAKMDRRLPWPVSSSNGHTGASFVPRDGEQVQAKTFSMHPEGHFAYQSTGVQQHPAAAAYPSTGSSNSCGANEGMQRAQAQVTQVQQRPQHVPTSSGSSQFGILAGPSHKRKRSASTSSDGTIDEAAASSVLNNMQQGLRCETCKPPCGKLIFVFVNPHGPNRTFSLTSYAAGERTNFRSKISHLVGRNKNVTKLIPSYLLSDSCRKSYQRDKYAMDQEGVWYIEQAELLKGLCDKLARWYDELNRAQGLAFGPLFWTIEMTKGVRDKPAENPIDNAIQQALTGQGLIGKNMTTRHVLRAVDVLRYQVIPTIVQNPPSKDGLIKDQQRNEFDKWLKSPNLGGIEFLPTGLEKAKKDGMTGIVAREKVE